MEEEKTEEKNSTLDQPKEWKAPTRMTSVNVDAGLHNQAKENNISLKDALEFGIRFKIAEIDGFEYPESKEKDKVQRLARSLQAKIDECEALRIQTDNNPDLEEELKGYCDKVFSEVEKDGK